MATRRDFLKGGGALAGLVFCGCGLPMAAHAQPKPARLPVTVKGKRIKAIDMEILSINPFWYGKPREVAEAVCRINHEKLAELCAQKPDRFGAFASLPMQ